MIPTMSGWVVPLSGGRMVVTALYHLGRISEIAAETNSAPTVARAMTRLFLTRTYRAWLMLTP